MFEDEQLKKNKEEYTHDYAKHPSEVVDSSPWRDVVEPLEMRQVRWLEDIISTLSWWSLGFWFFTRAMNSAGTVTITHSLWKMPTRITIYYYTSIVTALLFWIYSVEQNVQRTIGLDLSLHGVHSWEIIYATEIGAIGIEGLLDNVTDTTFDLTYTLIWGGSSGTIQALYIVE